MLQVKLVKSPIGNTKRNRATVAALGLRKMHQTVLLPDNESVRGMIFKVKHMLSVEEVEGKERKASTPKRARTGTKGQMDQGTKAAPKKSDKSEKADVVEKGEAKERAEKPKAEAKPKTQSKPKSEDKPKAKAKPKAAAKPKAPAKKKEKE